MHRVERRGAVACFHDSDVNGVILDDTSLFPFIDTTEGLTWGDSSNDEFLPEIVMKRFLFDGSKIAALKRELAIDYTKLFQQNNEFNTEVQFIKVVRIYKREMEVLLKAFKIEQ